MSIKYYHLETEIFQDTLSIYQLLYAHARNSQHCQTTVTQLLRLNIRKFLCICWLESEWVKATVGNKNNNKDNDDNEEEEEKKEGEIGLCTYRTYISPG